MSVHDHNSQGQAPVILAAYRDLIRLLSVRIHTKPTAHALEYYAGNGSYGVTGRVSFFALVASIDCSDCAHTPGRPTPEVDLQRCERHGDGV